jgi:S-adenosyl methyltransferase
VAETLIAAVPIAVEVTRENKQFVARAVTWAAGEVISQFIDVGYGMPTAPATHQVARKVFPNARVAC